MSARVGLEFEHGGHRQQIIAVDNEGVVSLVGRARLRVPYGDLITVAGHLSRLAPELPSPEVTERVRVALRAWRLERATAAGKPAYVFLHDRTLEELARSAPSSLAALAQVNGIGPAKFESYGDELLAIIAAARNDD